MPPRSRRFQYDPKQQSLVEVTAPPRVTHGHARWPIHSDAMAVHPSQVAQAQAALREHGVHTNYDAEGRPILESQSHRKRHAEALGFYDRNGGYGDPQRR